MASRRKQLPKLWPVTAADKQWARVQMEKLGMTQAELARRVSTTTAMISQFFDDDSDHPVRHSRFWPQIVAALGGAPPTVTTPSEVVDEHQRVVLERWPLMSSDERAAVSTLVIAMTTKRPA
ncbi:MAG TPA: helix-turn-helix transcriptional regulator [Microbacterium sp.]|nr:helix-turn-helix transcriptional regulator [Microbacterium sp.]